MRISHHPLTRRRRAPDERGHVLVMTALLLVPMLLMCALAVDVGGWYARGQEMQRAADAAALAGVVWMPGDFATAEQAARATAARNGFSHGTQGFEVRVERLPGQARRLRVTVVDPEVPTFFGGLVTDSIRMERTAVAEYQSPLPLGSPRNYLGTGDLGRGPNAENVWLSVNSYCTEKRYGDQKASRYESVDPRTCTGGTPNTEYDPRNYTYVVELPAARSYDTDVLVFDGNYLSSASEADDWAPSQYRLPEMSTTFTLRRADSTPFDDDDNPPMATVGGCSSVGAGRTGTKTFVPGVVEGTVRFDPGAAAFRGNPRWWQLCRIPAGAPGGRYLLDVSNQGGSVLERTEGMNQFGVVATPTSPQRICDGRTDVTCPRVYGRDSLSIRVAATASTADFFLAEVGPEYAGKRIQVSIYDPEDGQTIRLRRPTGTNSWVDQPFSWTATNGRSGTNVAEFQPRGFSGHSVTMWFDLPAGYSPPTDNEWFQVRYLFSGDTTDRTTWSVQALGNPVHLVE